MTVYLVGAGPGDPGLITAKGKELLSVADAVVYDRLANPKLLNVVPKDALKISAGKGPGSVDMTQDEINVKLVELGQEHNIVVRLKGGDPFVFGRGGEEAFALQEAGINFEVVPGITSAVAVPAYAGIPVTHRGVATNFTIVTGHEDPAKETEQVKWKELAQIDGTLVVLMGVANRKLIAQALIDGGKNEQTPVAIIKTGTLPTQELTKTTLSELGNVDAQNPSIIVIGDVASMSLEWFATKPLFGKKVVVTRAREQQSEIVEKLESLGAQVIQAPTISIEPIKFVPPSLDNVSYVIFTSINGVNITMNRLMELGIDARYFANSAIAAIGEATANELRKYGLIADIVPSRFVQEELLELIPTLESKSAPLSASDQSPTPDPANVRSVISDSSKFTNSKIIIFKAEYVRDVLQKGIELKGYSVKNIDVYTTHVAKIDAQIIEEIKSADAITFASSSTVKNAIEVFGKDVVESIPIKVSIGPITTTTMRDLGLEATVEADPHTIDGVVKALESSV